LVDKGGRLVAMGSGGSNRIRTALLQVLMNLTDFEMPLGSAVQAPRIHYEHDELNIETGFKAEIIEGLKSYYPNNRLWDDLNLYFGGAHTAAWDGKHFEGAGDPRRGGVCLRVN